MIATFVVAIILCIYVYRESVRLNTLYDQESQHSLDSSYKASRVTFCYDNDIHPCSDDGIKIWNNLHPDEYFSMSAGIIPTSSN